MWSERQAIELFHLVFVAQLGRRVDKALFTIKGGCNLRFFCRSIRYSEDIDFDVQTMAIGTLAKNVDTILGSPPFAQALYAKQIDIEHVTSAKQTATTQRWKIGIRVAGGPEIPTEIEFSRQKIGALSLRTVTQARDVFDIKQLLDGGAGREKLPAAVVREVPRAVENALTMGFDEFSGQVLAYLAADYQEYYRSRKVWESLQQEVVDALGRHAS
jgi:hypothetical protein